MTSLPLWPPDRLCVYCGYRQPDLLEVVDGVQRCIDRQDCMESREAQGIRSSNYRFREKVRP